MRKINAYPVEFYKTFWSGLNLNKEWRWRITASNGRIVASSSEGFKNKLDCEHNLLITGKSIKKYRK